MRRCRRHSMAKLGKAIVRRPAADLVSFIRVRPWPVILTTLPATASVSDVSSKSLQRSANSSPRRSPVAINSVKGSTKSCSRQYSDARNLASSARSPSAVSAGAPLGGRLDLICCTSRTGLVLNTFAITASCRPPLRIVLACRAITGPWVLLIDRSAASMRAGVASRTRTPPSFARSFPATTLYVAWVAGARPSSTSRSRWASTNAITVVSRPNSSRAPDGGRRCDSYVPSVSTACVE